jgi:hypothetical protein
MKASSKVIPLLFLFFSFNTLLAQDTLQVATPRQKAEVVTLRMERELSLTENQTQRVSVIVLERFETLQKGTSNKTKQLTAANDNAVKKLAGVLTTQQLTLYNQIKGENKKQKDDFLKKNPNYKFSNEDIELDF